MFDRIARRYDRVNRVISLGMDRGWRRRTVRSLQLGERPRVLDVATGTGDLAIDLAQMVPGATVIGLDPSEQMLAIAAEKVARKQLAERVTLVTGDAQALPFASCELDAATIAFGIRNVPDRPRALRELARVVRPGGRIAVLELGEPRRGVLGWFARFHTRHVVPRLGALLSGAREYAYLQRSIAAFPPAPEFVETMQAAGLHVVEVVPLAFGACTLFVATPAEDA
ncbi:MAG: bifunctional demethylmenaquinone methyltransferase/2-methoxy-6-polyprenyl-1,4-benzoquinol methylase UbiE [Deltaproteobacteria bacterium]|nr:bifunctional demethylmenaquinone methyltransferase/2-methoxy-6-polyprenyl-1,4-benzoquinol methylase UbiE [Deltaproteobacteria bacterium]